VDHTRQSHDGPITIRDARVDDAEALRRLAQRDSASVPDGRLLVAIADGELRAAVSIADGEGIADPFHPSAGLARLLCERAAQLRGSGDGQRGRFNRILHQRGAASARVLDSRTATCPAE
jgi:hypothetical protein